MLPVVITVNGVRCEAEVEPRTLLVDFIRDTVGLDRDEDRLRHVPVRVLHHPPGREAVKSCTVLAVQADGSSVTTIEGLSDNGGLHPIQQAFWDKHGLQCGFCTPGMIMTTAELVAAGGEPTDDEIRHAIEGNLCRCTGYENIVRAIREATHAGAVS